MPAAREIRGSSLARLTEWCWTIDVRKSNFQSKRAPVVQNIERGSPNSTRPLRESTGHAGPPFFVQHFVRSFIEIPLEKFDE